MEDMMRTVGDGRLLIHPFSKGLFADSEEYTLSQDPFAEAKACDFCFIENLPIAPFADKIDRLYLYKWNRSYPATAHLDLDPIKSGFHLVDTVEFVGSSHEKITKETYTK